MEVAAQTSHTAAQKRGTDDLVTWSTWERGPVVSVGIIRDHPL